MIGVQTHDLCLRRCGLLESLLMWTNLGAKYTVDIMTYPSRLLERRGFLYRPHVLLGVVSDSVRNLATLSWFITVALQTEDTHTV